MEGEVEKLFMEYDIDNRGRISAQQIDLLFKTIGITLSIKDLRSLIFQYDKTKKKDLDLEEFRQLINGIVTMSDRYSNEVASYPSSKESDDVLAKNVQLFS